MAQRVNIESKNLLARLLASENIWIRHQQTPTASFNLVSRILTLPMWTEMSDGMYTMLIAHEVGHALYDERAYVNVFGKRIDPLHPKAAGTYWNIVADARVERLICNPYPGLRRTFAAAYLEMYERDILNLGSRDINGCILIDRINLHFKIGHIIKVQFTPEEQVLVDKVAKTLTSDDVISVAKEIYEWAKEHEIPPPPPPAPQPADETDDAEPGDSPSTIDDDNGDETGNSSSESESNSESEDSPGSCSDSEDGTDSSDSPSSSDDNASESEIADAAESENDTTDSKPVDPGPPPQPTTQKAFDEMLKQLIDHDVQAPVYVTLPAPNLKNILVDYRDVHSEIRAFPFRGILANYKKSRSVTKSPVDNPSTSTNYFAKAARQFAEFQDLNLSKVNYLVQRFNMKKQADRYKRTKIHKTGTLDTLRLHEYKFSSDIFKSLAVATDGQSHGMIFVVDWSASMRGSMAGTLEQLIVLSMFCRKAAIPFEVYSLTTGGKNAFSKDDGNLVYVANFSMRCYLSSRMTNREFIDACVDLFALMPDGMFVGGPRGENLIGCTPLDEAIVTTIDIIEAFRKRTNVQIVNAIFLTDGDANTVRAYYNHKIEMPISLYRLVIDDRQTHKVYEFDMHHMTPTLLAILRDRQKIHVSGFYVGGNLYRFFSDDDKILEAAKKQFDEDGYVVCTDWGYDELYITKNGDALRVRDCSIVPNQDQPGSSTFQAAASQNLIQRGKDISRQRVMLDRFATLITRQT